MFAGNGDVAVVLRETAPATPAERRFMKCAWYQRWLTAYADDELVGWRAVWMHRHLAGCAHCVAALAKLRRVRQLVASQKPLFVGQLDDAQFWPQLRQQLQAPDTAAESGGFPLLSWFPGRRFALATVTASLVVATVVGGWLTLAPNGGWRLAGELPLLPPVGGSKVEFKDLKYAKHVWAGEVRFDKPDVDIPVIWVNGLTVAENELDSPNNSEGL
jgi:Putative zinc-finger